MPRLVSILDGIGDYQDELIIKELNRYKLLLDGFMKFRKMQLDYKMLDISRVEKGAGN